MADFISAPIPVDPDDLKARAFDVLRSAFPDWDPYAANLDAWIIEAFAEIVAQIGETATEVPASIFRAFGRLIGLPPIDAVTASASATFVLTGSTGFTIPAGTNVGWSAGSDDQLVAFQTSADVVVPVDTPSVSGVALTAVEPGTVANDLTGPGEVLDALDFVQDVTLDFATGGGADAEDDDVYLDRLANELRLLAPRPIVPSDFAEFLKNRIAEVDRAVAINGWNPADDTLGNEKTVAIAAVRADGTPISGASKTAAVAMLQAQREVNFVVSVVDATYTAIDVAFAVTVWPGWDPAVVRDQAIEAARQAVSPANFGQPSFGEVRGWVNDTKLRYLEVAQAINSVEGVQYVTSLSVNGGTDDVTLNGRVSLPTPGAITGTAS